MLTAETFAPIVDAVHQLGCVHTSRDGFISESVTGLGADGEQVLSVVSQDVANPSRVSYPHRRLLVVNQPLEEATAFLLAGLALHQAQAVLWQGARILPAGSKGGVLPAVCTVGVLRGEGTMQARLAVVHSYGSSGVHIDDEPVQVGDVHGGGAAGVPTMRDAYVRRVARWVASLVPSVDVSGSPQ